MSESATVLHPIPAFNDNYIWLLSAADTTTNRACAVVDPGDAEPVLKVLSERGLQLKTILLTHHHHDHAGGVERLLETYPAVVYGPHDRRLGPWCRPCQEGDTVELDGLGLRFSVLDVPAHTRSHISFHGHGMLFSGDTLFSIGCGRLFEGSPEDMQAALEKLAQLDPQTQVYCGHEYTVSNIDFALQVEPDNQRLQQLSEQARAARTAGKPTLPCVLADELQANPFMRTCEPTVVARAQQIDPNATAGASTLGVIRAWKDRL